MYEDENKRDIHARSSSAARLASSRRAAGCGNEPMSKFLPRTTGIQKVTRELKSFAVVDIEYEHCTLLAQPLASFSCAYKREVAPLRETHQNYFFLSPPVSEHCVAATIFPIPACGLHRRSGQ